MISSLCSLDCMGVMHLMVSFFLFFSTKYITSFTLDTHFMHLMFLPTQYRLELQNVRIEIQHHVIIQEMNIKRQYFIFCSMNNIQNHSLKYQPWITKRNTIVYAKVNMSSS